MRSDPVTEFKSQYENYKGFISACLGNSYRSERLVINVYIEDIDHLSLYPTHFQDYDCEFTICPDGMSPGCD